MNKYMFNEAIAVFLYILHREWCWGVSLDLQLSTSGLSGFWQPVRAPPWQALTLDSLWWRWENLLLVISRVASAALQFFQTMSKKLQNGVILYLLLRGFWTWSGLVLLGCCWPVPSLSRQRSSSPFSRTFTIWRGWTTSSMCFKACRSGETKVITRILSVFCCVLCNASVY